MTGEHIRMSTENPSAWRRVNDNQGSAQPNADALIDKRIPPGKASRAVLTVQVCATTA